MPLGAGRITTVGATVLHFAAHLRTSNPESAETTLRLICIPSERDTQRLSRDKDLPALRCKMFSSLHSSKSTEHYKAEQQRISYVVPEELTKYIVHTNSKTAKDSIGTRLKDNDNRVMQEGRHL